MSLRRAGLCPEGFWRKAAIDGRSIDEIADSTCKSGCGERHWTRVLRDPSFLRFDKSNKVPLFITKLPDSSKIPVRRRKLTDSRKRRA